MRNVIIKDLTGSEADYLQAVCNFTPDEQQLFELRLEDCTLQECADVMNRTIDSIKRLSRKVNAKINKETC